MNTSRDGFLGELRLGWRLTSRGQVAAGGLAVAVGLLFLLSGPALSLMGPRTALAGVLAGLVLALTLLSILELLGGSGERGGIYMLIQEVMGGWGAFVTGWSILAGCMVLIAALIQSAGHQLLQLLPAVPLPPATWGLALLALLALVQFLTLRPRRTWLLPVSVLLFVTLAVVVVTVLPEINLRRYQGSTVPSFRDMMRVVAWLAAGYAALEAILASRRQISDPARHLPQAAISVLLTGSLGFAFLTLVAAGVRTATVPSEAGLAGILTAATPLPAWISPTLTIAAALVAAHTVLITAARQLHWLSLVGGLPRALRRQPPPFITPPLLAALPLAAACLMLVFVPLTLLMDAAAGLFLVPLIALNVAAIHSHRSEPDRRRTFVVPFYPLVPAVTIAISVGLVLALQLPGLLATAGWLTLGLIVYVVYARRRQLAAREGISVFGVEGRGEKKREGEYRILVPLASAGERHLALQLAAALARQHRGEVIPLQVIPVPDPLAIEEGRRLAQERNALFRWSTRLGRDSGVEVRPITRLARSIPQGIVDTAIEEQCDLILMPWIEHTASPRTTTGSVVTPVVREAPVDVAVVSLDPESDLVIQDDDGEPGLNISSILVPTAGGPHAPLATSLAVSLARELEATVTAIYVTRPAASAADIAQGEARIQDTIEAMRQQAAELVRADRPETAAEEMRVESRVVEATSVVKGIADTGKEYDLVFVGASNERLIDQVMFGNVPEQIARACPTPVVMVKRYRGLPRFWLQRTWDALFGILPTLSREEQLEVNRQIRAGAHPDVDFFVMMALAALIATLGLLQDSAAVIIGAMLVAPLFTPILAMSLGIVQGHALLLRMAIEAALKGIALAIGAAVLFVALSPLRTVTAEIVARTQPNLFDLAVALASGAAGAYAMARKDVAASLPGVAIAAALVPPLATAGIGLATGDLGVAGGALLLFATNLTAIVLAGAVTLLLLGFRPAPRQEQEARLRWGLLTTVILLLLITIPLSVVFVRSVSESRTRQVIQQTLAEELHALPEANLESFTFETTKQEVSIHVTLYATRSLTRSEGEQLSQELGKALGRPTRLRLVTIPISEIDVSPR